MSLELIIIHSVRMFVKCPFGVSTQGELPSPLAYLEEFF